MGTTMGWPFSGKTLHALHFLDGHQLRRQFLSSLPLGLAPVGFGPAAVALNGPGGFKYKTSVFYTGGQ